MYSPTIHSLPAQARVDDLTRAATTSRPSAVNIASRITEQRSSAQCEGSDEDVAFHDILVAVDGSPEAERALAYAIELADRGHARLTLLTAAAQPRPLAYWGFAAMGAISFFQRADAEARKVATLARARVPDRVPVTAVVTGQPVRQALARQISNGQHDLVVIGSRGRGGARSARRGKLSRYVVRHSLAPILIVGVNQGDLTSRPSRRANTRPTRSIELAGERV